MKRKGLNRYEHHPDWIHFCLYRSHEFEERICKLWGSTKTTTIHFNFFDWINRNVNKEFQRMQLRVKLRRRLFRKKSEMIILIIFLNFFPPINKCSTDLIGYHFNSNFVDDVTNFVKIVAEKNISYDSGITICLRTQVTM